MGEVKIQFKKASDYKLIPVTGAWGGINPQGEVVVDLFVERVEIESIKVTAEQGQPSVEIAREGEIHVREVLVGLVVRPDIARAIGEFLIQMTNETSSNIITLGGGGRA